MPRRPMTVFRTRVTRVRPLSRDFLRVSLAAPELTELALPAGDGSGPVLDAYLKLLLPHPEHEGPVLPDLEAEDWHRAWFAASARERGGWMRTYTLRAARPWTSPEGTPGVEIDVDFVLHGHGDQQGPGAAWAAAARVGDELSLLGPTREDVLWGTWDPGRAERYLLGGDETAVPAACSVLEALPHGAPAAVLLEVPEGNARELAASLPEAAARPEVRVRWLERAPEQVRGRALLSALREELGLVPRDAEEDAAGIAVQRAEPGELVWGRAERGEDPAGLSVWLAAEAAVVRAARRVCVNEAGIDRRRISFMGYWKAGQAES